MSGLCGKQGSKSFVFHHYIPISIGCCFLFLVSGTELKKGIINLIQPCDPICTDWDALNMYCKLIHVPQREEALLLFACACCHGEWRAALHSEREVKSSCGAGAEPVGRVQKDQHSCCKPCWTRTAPTPVPQHMSLSTLLRVRFCVCSPFFFLFFFFRKSQDKINSPIFFGFVFCSKQTGVHSFSGKLTNRCKVSFKGESAKL